eukprot:3060117-Amphidinium_carterae.1
MQSYRWKLLASTRSQHGGHGDKRITVLSQAYDPRDAAYTVQQGHCLVTCLICGCYIQKKWTEQSRRVVVGNIATLLVEEALRARQNQANTEGLLV